MQNKTKALIYLSLCIFLWSIIPVAAKLAQNNLDNHQFLFWSSLISFLTLFFVSIFTKKIKYIKKYKSKDWFNVIILGLLGTYIYYLFLYLGYKKSSGLEVLIIQYTWPISVVVLSIFLLKEKLTIQKLASIILGFLGVVLVITKGDLTSIEINNISVISLVFLGAFCFALFSVLSKKISLEPISLTTIYFLSATIASFCSMIYFSSFQFPNIDELFPVILNGILLNGISYLFWIEALKNSEATYLAPFIFTIPILSAIYLIVIFDEKIYISYIFGLFLVVCAGLINSMKKK